MNSIKTYVDIKREKVFFIITFKGVRFQVCTGITSDTKFTGLDVSQNVKDWKIKSRKLAMLYAKIDEFMFEHRDMSVELMKDNIKAIITGGEVLTSKPFLDYLREFTDKKTTTTKDIYERTIIRIKAYDEKCTFDTIDKDWLTNFQEYEAQKGRTTNGIAIDLRNIRTIFNWAIDNEYTAKYPFRRFNIKSERVAINNITLEQLRQLRDMNFHDDWREIYRDFFMLSFYLCGINPVDLLNLKKGNLKNGRITYKRAKTGRLYDIPVCEEAMKIIERYRGKDWLLCPLDSYKDYKDFNHHWNDALKKMGEISIWPDKLGKMRKVMYKPIAEGMTVYTARYTFASIGAELDIPREIIALCLGHAWTDVTSHYINYDNKKIDDAVKKIVGYVNADKK